jgi:3-hydroxyisobutyrate dehydrogenase
MKTVCFIGLGNMGAPMAHNLIKAGYKVLGVDLAKANLDKHVENGGEVASLADALSRADIVVTMLPSGKEVRALYLGEKGINASVKRGAILIDSSTIDVDTSRVVASDASSRGLHMIDAPVSGGVGGATAATLTFMCGGADGDYNKALPILEKMGKTIVHAGGSGNGQAAKICNNMILGITMIATSEAFVLAEKLGLEAQKLFDIASKSSGQSWSMTSYCPVPDCVPTSPANRDYQAGFSAAMMLKDLKLSQEAARLAGASTPMGAEAASLYSLYCGQGEAGKDFSGIVQFLRGKV